MQQKKITPPPIKKSEPQKKILIEKGVCTFEVEVRLFFLLF